LLNDLAEVGARGAVTVLLARDPVSNVLLDDLRGVKHLLEALDMVRARDVSAMLADRISRQMPVHCTLGTPAALGELGIGDLLKTMHAIGAIDATASLASRAARGIPLDDQRQVQDLLEVLHEIGATEPIAILLIARPGSSCSAHSAPCCSRWGRAKIWLMFWRNWMPPKPRDCF
jgi:hypothetical protein